MFAILLVSAGKSYAQTVPGSDAWPMDSVVKKSLHHYTVYGDSLYTKASTFVWTVDGGTIYLSSDTSLSANKAPLDTTVTLTGDINNGNRSRIWVIWDRFDQPLDTGYVCVHEISDDGCSYSATEAKAYQGMWIKVSAPPKVKFLTDSISLCAYDPDTAVIVSIDGMPPYELAYGIDGKSDKITINQSDLSDLDGDGAANEYAFPIKGFQGTTTELKYYFELFNAWSGGVEGKVLEYSSCTVLIHVQPTAPEILSNDIEVTKGISHTYYLQTPGVNVTEYYWSVYTSDGQLVSKQETGSTSNVSITWPDSAGVYYITVNYTNGVACDSPEDTLWVTVFDAPTITFSDLTGNIKTCSALIGSTDSLDFLVQYTGATWYGFTYSLYDYDGNLVFSKTVTNLNEREFWVSFLHDLMNVEKPEENRKWTLKISNALNYEGSSVTVTVINGERTIEIYPKPVIEGEINIVNTE